MGLYLRKTLCLGPLHVNLSTHGIGLSAGVTGARFGLDASGHPYTQVGRHGICYRKRWPTPGHMYPPPPPTGPPPAETHDRVSVWPVLLTLLGLVVAVILLKRLFTH